MQAWPVAHAQKVAALARQEPAALITALPTNIPALTDWAPPPLSGGSEAKFCLGVPSPKEAVPRSALAFGSRRAPAPAPVPQRCG